MKYKLITVYRDGEEMDLLRRGEYEPPFGWRVLSVNHTPEYGREILLEQIPVPTYRDPG
jgi:hypothetical protein